MNGVISSLKNYLICLLFTHLFCPCQHTCIWSWLFLPWFIQPCIHLASETIHYVDSGICDCWHGKKSRNVLVSKCIYITHINLILVSKCTHSLLCFFFACLFVHSFIQVHTVIHFLMSICATVAYYSTKVHRKLFISRAEALVLYFSKTEHLCINIVCMYHILSVIGVLHHNALC